MAALDSTTSVADQEQQDKNQSISAMATSASNSQASPRNTVTPAGAFVQLGSVEVSKSLQDGEKFVKWDEVSVHVSL